MARIRKELVTIEKSEQPDPFFDLSAAALLWQSEKLDAAQEIAKLYQQAGDLTVQYNYVFIPCFEAAQTDDDRALPMLKQPLRDDKGTYYLWKHALELRWPQTISYLWGLYGAKRVPALLDVLKTSTSPIELRSVVCLLTEDFAVDALPEVRKLIKHDDPDLRRDAIVTLGTFGHPDDFQLLVSGLDSKDPMDAAAYALALGEYQDLRAATPLAKLLASDAEKVRTGALATLMKLLCPVSLEAFHEQSSSAKSSAERTAYGSLAERTLKQFGLDWASYAAMSKDEQRQLFLKRHREAFDKKYSFHAGDQRLTHEQFLAAAQDWIDRHRITGGDYVWVEERHLLEACTRADIPKLLEVRAAVYSRLSDECLEEIEILDRVIKWLGRAGLRKVPGVCEKVEPAPKSR